MPRPVKLTVLLEIELATELTDDEAVFAVSKQFEDKILPEWKGFEVSMPGAFVGRARRISVALGHNQFAAAPPAARTRNRKAKK